MGNLKENKSSKNHSRRRKKRRRILWKRVLGLVCIPVLVVLLLVAGFRILSEGGLNLLGRRIIPGFAESPSQALQDYVEELNAGEYEKMYHRLSQEARERVSEEDFRDRHQRIYQGIAASDIRVEFPEECETELEEGILLSYTMSLETCAGTVTFDNTARFVNENGGSRLDWTDAMIFPDLEATDTVRVSTTAADRGSLYDRDGNLLAGNGTATSVGLVPGKMEEDSVTKLARILDSTEESIQKKLSAAWVKEDSFVPIRTIRKLTEEEKDAPTPETEELADFTDALLKIPGVKLQDTGVRIYPMGEYTAHLIGYVQTISQEELEKAEPMTYTAGSLIGKAGLERSYEARLRGKSGHRISLVTESGEIRRVLAIANPVKGENITLTIDSALQRQIFDTYRDQETGTIAMNPTNGEVLALVSTPSYDPNQFSLGIREDQWNLWNEDPRNPLLNRFRSLWTPGSSMKSITGAIGISTGLLDPEEDLESEHSWRADKGWGDYRVTTLHVSSPSNLVNGLILSDNVYFAKAAVQIGEDAMEEGWKKFGFGEEIPFPLAITSSSFSTEEHLTSQIQLADSGYGQGQMQVSPVHMAVMYSAFVNNGSMIQPQLELGQSPQMWHTQVISQEACDRIASALGLVVSNGYGTAHSGYLPELPFAGKTGTAELKASREEEDGQEIGWFTSFTTQTPPEDTLLLSTMVESVEDIGGSGYVVRNSRDIYRFYYGELPKEEGSEEDEQE